MADRVILDVEMGAFDELPLINRQSFKDGDILLRLEWNK
jgi:hypothetical protein